MGHPGRDPFLLHHVVTPGGTHGSIQPSSPPRRLHLESHHFWPHPACLAESEERGPVPPPTTRPWGGLWEQDPRPVPPAPRGHCSETPQCHPLLPRRQESRSSCYFSKSPCPARKARTRASRILQQRGLLQSAQQRDNSQEML